jgi:ATP-dependent Clp protease ATP-binding subunit ClpX
MEGREVHPYEPRSCSENHQNRIIDTTNILFVAGGAFSQLTGFRGRDLRCGIGFKHLQSNFLNQNKITIDDITGFGLIPEFLGRFSMILQFNMLTHGDLVKIFRQTLSKEIVDLAAAYDIEVEVSREVEEYIATEAYQKKTGARALII